MTKTQGNPVTARQIDYEASEQAKMGKTQLSRVYEQHDWLYAEKYRRATNPKLTVSVRGGQQALDLWKRCLRRGVPTYALRCPQSVRATRVVGQGSSFMRQQALEFLIGLLGTLPETGRFNLIRDVIASRAGQSHVDRYAPRQVQDTGMLAQQSDAMQQVASMKAGVPPVMVPTQDPMVYAQTFTQAAQGAMQAIQQGGGDPHEGISFLDLAVPAAQQHIQRMSQDKSRAGAVKQLGQQIGEVQQFAEHAKEQLMQAQQEKAQAAQQLQAVQQGTDPETQIGLAKVQSAHQRDMFKASGNLQLKGQKQAADLALQAHKQQVETALEDAATAHGLNLDSRKAAATIRDGNRKK